MDIDQLRTNSTIEETGRWIDYGDARFLIASTASKAYRQAVRKAAKALPPHLRQDPDQVEKLGLRCAKHLLLGWENLKDKGEPLEFNPENVAKVLAIRAFADWVAEQAADIVNFRNEVDGEDLEAVKKPSLGD